MGYFARNRDGREGSTIQDTEVGQAGRHISLLATCLQRHTLLVHYSMKYEPYHATAIFYNPHNPELQRAHAAAVQFTLTCVRTSLCAQVSWDGHSHAHPENLAKASASAIGFITFSQEYASNMLYACRSTPISTYSQGIQSTIQIIAMADLETARVWPCSGEQRYDSGQGSRARSGNVQCTIRV